MKLALIIAIAMASFSSFSQASTERYTCQFSATLNGENLKATLELGPELKIVSIQNQDHSYDLVIFEHEGRRQFQMMEGWIKNDVYISTSSFSTDMNPGQQTFRASTFICNSEISCWSINCALN